MRALTDYPIIYKSRASGVQLDVHHRWLSSMLVLRVPTSTCGRMKQTRRVLLPSPETPLRPP
eukprot:386129-Pyramimonas_sp.AAC.1